MYLFFLFLLFSYSPPFSIKLTINNLIFKKNLFS
nr:MAG TPA: hypothetical protein [Caudoviricetes sp.]